MPGDNTVILSAGNISHYHHTALALQEIGVLKKYYTVFTGQEAGWLVSLLPASLKLKLQSKDLIGLDQNLIEALRFPYLFSQTLKRLKVINLNQSNVVMSKLFDYFIKKHDDEVKIFHFVNGFGLVAAKKFKEKGVFIICDVRAPHIDIQENVLGREFEKLGLKYQSTRSLLRDQLLEEYSIADKLIVPSDYAASTFINQGVRPEKISVIPYGAQLEVGDCDKIPKKTNQFRILFVGNIIPGKGLHYLIEAFNRLKIRDAELILIGGIHQGYRNILDRMIGKPNSIRYIGHIPQQILAGYYKSADVFVLPSLSEGSALVVYEAMSHGLPVVVSENTGSVVKDGHEGFVTQAGNAADLADKLNLLYEHPELKEEMGRAAMRSAQRFSWDSYRKRIQDLYQELELA